jgi:hypothetical protein
LRSIGHHIGIRNLDDGSMKFILLPENVKEINSMKVTSNRKHLLVCANHHPSNDLILTIFDLKNPD